MKSRTLAWLAASWAVSGLGCIVAVAESAGQAAPLASPANTQSLVEAARVRDADAVRAFLEAAVYDVNASQPDGATALAWASHWDDLEMVGALIRAGADVDAANDLGVTPLMLASANGSAKMVGALLRVIP